MTLQRKEIFIHWNYFLALEEDLDRLSRYVDFSGNENTYSIEIARIFLAACSEVDVILKQLAKKLNPASTASSINAYFSEIVPKIKDLIAFGVIIPRFGLTLHPWHDWDDAKPPFWWQDHNKIKHHRHEYFERANLKNCLNAIAALYIVVLYYYKNNAEQGDLQQLPRLFNVSDEHFGGTSMGRFGHSFKYRLPIS